uniref:anthranilate N-benzoyltransferase n=1 Tax=Chenopodium quinoa TaxID=63459 RepID=A0A803MBW2_CHEQI
MVCPSEETPKGSLWLSKLDMMIRTPYSHSKVLFVYTPPSNFFDTNTMKEALSRALVPFYPMAGRLILNNETGRYEIDCNAKGALFIDAESIHALVDFGDYLRLDFQLKEVVFPVCDYTGGLSSFPLLLVQATHFSCGSVCLGFAQHQHVGDGTSQLHFINSWARLAKGLDLSVQPIHDRVNYLISRDPPQVKFRHLEYEPSLPSLPPKGLSGEMVTETECIFKLTKEQVNGLKLNATSQDETTYKLSTFEVQSGHVWRSVCLARGLADDQDVKLYIPVEGRSRLNDMEVPPGYCGNILFYAACVEKAGDVASKPLWYAASKIHEAIKKMDNVEYLRSAIDFVESHQDLMAIVRGPQTPTCPNLTINSWARLPCYEADFGWGRPKFIGVNGIKHDGNVYITTSSNGDGSFLVAIKLFTPHMTLFKHYFYNI